MLVLLLVLSRVLGAEDCDVLKWFATTTSNAAAVVGWRTHTPLWCCGGSGSPQALGITCNGDARVVSLDMGATSIVGEVPPAFLNLTSLVHLAIRDSRISVTSLPTSLVYLELPNCHVGGGVAWLAPLTGLTFLDLRGNALEGNLSAIQGATDLTVLVLSNNNLGGDIRPLASLNMLSLLDLSYNHIGGDLSPLSGLPLLSVLSLEHNQISGDLQGLTSLVSLTSARLSHNRLRGPLEALTDMVDMSELYMDYNMLEGGFGGLSNQELLVTLSASNNAFTGRLDDLVYNTQLVRLDLSDNAIIGDLSVLRNLTILHSLSLARNSLTGALDVLAEVPTLTHVDLAGNFLDGSLAGLSELQRLSFLNASSNALGGGISPLDGLMDLAVLDLASNRLEGVVPVLRRWQEGGVSVAALAGNAFACPSPPVPARALVRVDACAGDGALSVAWACAAGGGAVLMFAVVRCAWARACSSPPEGALWCLRWVLRQGHVLLDAVVVVALLAAPPLQQHCQLVQNCGVFQEVMPTTALICGTNYTTFRQYLDALAGTASSPPAATSSAIATFRDLCGRLACVYDPGQRTCVALDGPEPAILRALVLAYASARVLKELARAWLLLVAHVRPRRGVPSMAVRFTSPSLVALVACARPHIRLAMIQHRTSLREWMLALVTEVLLESALHLALCLYYMLGAQHERGPAPLPVLLSVAAHTAYIGYVCVSTCAVLCAGLKGARLDSEEVDQLVPGAVGAAKRFGSINGSVDEVRKDLLPWSSLDQWYPERS